MHMFNAGLWHPAQRPRAPQQGEPAALHRRGSARTRAFAARGYGKAYTPQLMAGNATVARPSRSASCRQLLLARQVLSVQRTAADDIRGLRQLGICILTPPASKHWLDK